MEELLQKHRTFALSAGVGGFIFLLALVRLSGKRVVSEGTAFDFVLAVVLGDLIDNAIWGTAPVSQFVVAAGTLVPEETRIPPRSLVMGRPGKVRRELSDQEVASILDYAGRYVGYRLHYMPQVS